MDISNKDTCHDGYPGPGYCVDLLFKVTEVELHLSLSSSISMARFVTTGTIDLNLVHMFP
jgi:hypothetical protein